MMIEIRPWGEYRILEDSDECKVKRISVLSGSRLSYQYHHKREEVWVIVKGSGIVTIDDKIVDVSPGSIVHIRKEQKHRIENTGKENLEFIEVQLGDYFGEDDIVRLQDDYNRV